MIGLIFSCYGKRTGRHVIGYCRACGGKRTFPYSYGGNKICITSYKCVVGNFTSVLAVAVIVYRDYSATEVYSCADVAVAYISEMRSVSVVSYCRIFNFHKVADFYTREQMRVRPYMAERSDFYIALKRRIVNLSGINDTLRTDFRI